MPPVGIAYHLGTGVNCQRYLFGHFGACFDLPSMELNTQELRASSVRVGGPPPTRSIIDL